MPNASTAPQSSAVQRVVYTARVHTTGGRERGVSKSSDGRLEVRHSIPGAPGDGTNPEQLFAAGWSACFESSLGVVARKMKVPLPPELAIDAEVDLCLADGGYLLRARLNVSMPGLERSVAQAMTDGAEQICPYSKAIHGNVDVVIRVV
jgi:lipoyl-dependent peroxiredoxin